MKHTSGIIIIIVSLSLGGIFAYELLKPPQIYERTILHDPETNISNQGIADFYASTSTSSVPTTSINQADTPNQVIDTMSQVRISTNKGEITVELFANDAPNTVNNFLKLTNDGFYDGVIFHRVIPGFMIQGGDPTGTGTGGPGYRFEDELNPNTASYQRGYVRGTLAMANAGPNTNGSQFFIMHQDYPLPNSYTIFGRVVEGMEVVDAIAASPTDGRDKPLEDVVMESVRVVE